MLTRLLELGCLPVGAVLLALAIWMRRGCTRHARFWVRRWDAWQPERRLDAEMFCLLWWPVVALWMICTGLASLLSLLGASPSNLGTIVALLGGLIAMLIIAALMLVSGIAVTSAPGAPNLLRVWMYPPWLRERRASERRWIRNERLPAGQRPGVGEPHRVARGNRADPGDAETGQGHRTPPS